MNLAFYYHIPIIRKGEALYCPGFLGVFLDSIALEVNSLTLVMHESNDEKDLDYRLKNKNIQFISLGDKTPAWHRMLMHKSILQKKLLLIKNCDALLVRSPTPLSPYFKKYVGTMKLSYLVVGDYEESGKLIKKFTLKNFLVKIFLKIHSYIFTGKLKENHTIVNSRVLYDKYRKIIPNLDFVRTTTLSKSDCFERKDTCVNQKINILYTGRIEWEKGLSELVNALPTISFKNTHLNIVGWEEDAKKPVENQLKKIAQYLGIENRITFHGYRTIGDQLNEMYRMADIYVMPSYNEGFPRTIWEAMGNCVPVITTSVGSIPLELTDGYNALIINPKRICEIKAAVERLIVDQSLRRCLIENGFNKAFENTLEKNSLELINIIKKNDNTWS